MQVTCDPNSNCKSPCGTCDSQKDACVTNSGSCTASSGDTGRCDAGSCKVCTRPSASPSHISVYVFDRERPKQTLTQPCHTCAQRIPFCYVFIIRLRYCAHHIPQAICVANDPCTSTCVCPAETSSCDTKDVCRVGAAQHGPCVASSLHGFVCAWMPDSGSVTILCAGHIRQAHAIHGLPQHPGSGGGCSGRRAGNLREGAAL